TPRGRGQLRAGGYRWRRRRSPVRSPRRRGVVASGATGGPGVRCPGAAPSPSPSCTYRQSAPKSPRERSGSVRVHPHAAKNEHRDRVDFTLPLHPRRGKAPPLKAGVDQPHGRIQILLRHGALVNSRTEDALEQCGDFEHVLTEPGNRIGRDDAAQISARSELVSVLEHELLADVDPKLLLWVVDALQRMAKVADEVPRLVLDERKEQILLIGEVVVHRRAPDLRPRGDLREGHRFETAFLHEFSERSEELLSHPGTMFS